VKHFVTIENNSSQSTHEKDAVIFVEYYFACFEKSNLKTM
jgi:hypothetical protein